ncbi:MAG: metallophosphoesterase family protein [Syntrophobacteraceae bacterium]
MEEYLAAVLSDTHGLVRPELTVALAGVQLIIHAGDIDRPEVVETLETIAPVVAVRGNVDREELAVRYPRATVAEAGGALIYVLHDLHDLDLDPAAAGFQAVVSGHSHKPSMFRKDGVLYLNPGSAGPRRFMLPVTFALLRIRDKTLIPEIVRLTD